MLQGIIDNLGTIIVSLLLIGLVTGIIMKLRRDKKRGKSACGSNCGCCPLSEACHKQS